jgi:hypothetical protein
MEQVFRTTKSWGRSARKFAPCKANRFNKPSELALSQPPCVKKLHRGRGGPPTEPARSGPLLDATPSAAYSLAQFTTLSGAGAMSSLACRPAGAPV